MDRKTRELYARVLEQAVLMTLEGTIRSSTHSRQRDELRDITPADAEATILDKDARVIRHNPNHPEGVTYEIAGRKASGDEIHVIIAFDTRDLSEVTMMTVVTVMYPQR
ncbi:MAG: hypothetical protein M3176_13730 [Chloroflexota bacterium]|nr:hypothetical protein [Chloroflexota bacterium]MDQ6907878.1 hypothetical protein [Chloroflexota bacterium]